MNFQDKYTTLSKIIEVNLDKDATAGAKAAEDKKIVISEEAFLQAELTQNLINKIEHARVSLM